MLRIAEELLILSQVATVYGGPPGEGYFDTEADKKILSSLVLSRERGNELRLRIILGILEGLLSQTPGKIQFNSRIPKSGSLMLLCCRMWIYFLATPRGLG